MDLRSAIIATSQDLGIDPIDLATAMSYETAGTFDPWKAGPTTQWGQHRGLIQWGEPQARRYGVFAGMPVADQVAAAGRYLRDAGVRAGMGLLDIYSAINAGRVGRYGASDANNGGAPGTVADKVNNQMAGHRQNAVRLIGGGGPAPQPGLSSPMVPPSEPVTQTPPANTGLGALIAGLGDAFSAGMGGGGGATPALAGGVGGADVQESGPLAGAQVAQQGVMEGRALRDSLLPVVEDVATSIEPMKLVSPNPSTTGPFGQPPPIQPFRASPRPAPLMGGIRLRA